MQLSPAYVYELAASSPCEMTLYALVSVYVATSLTIPYWVPIVKAYLGGREILIRSGDMEEGAAWDANLAQQGAVLLSLLFGSTEAHARVANVPGRQLLPNCQLRCSIPAKNMPSRSAAEKALVCHPLYNSGTDRITHRHYISCPVALFDPPI